MLALADKFFHPFFIVLMTDKEIIHLANRQLFSLWMDKDTKINNFWYILNVPMQIGTPNWNAPIEN